MYYTSHKQRGPHNMVRATITALGMLRTPEDIARSSGKEVAQLGVTV